VTLQAQPQEEKNGDAQLGYSGRTALRREQCNGFAQSIAKQRLDKRLYKTLKQQYYVFHGIRAEKLS
jgi:hypothetical protein